MTIVGAFDVHRSQLTFDYLDLDTGEISRGRIAPADRPHLREWLRRFEGCDDIAFALEGCTGWRYVTEELRRVGVDVHLAEPADTAALRGKKRRAKTDRSDAAHIRMHLQAGDLPESWIPPEHVLETRVLVRLYKDLLDERGAWTQRVHATLFHEGVPVPGSLTIAANRKKLEVAELSPASRLAVDAGLRQIDRLNVEMAPLQRSFERLSRHQPGVRALRTTHYGIGPVTSVAIWAAVECINLWWAVAIVRHPLVLFVVGRWLE